MDVNGRRFLWTGYLQAIEQESRRNLARLTNRDREALDGNPDLATGGKYDAADDRLADMTTDHCRRPSARVRASRATMLSASKK